MLDFCVRETRLFTSITACSRNTLRRDAIHHSSIVTVSLVVLLRPLSHRTHRPHRRIPPMVAPEYNTDSRHDWPCDNCSTDSCFPRGSLGHTVARVIQEYSACSYLGLYSRSRLPRRSLFEGVELRDDGCDGCICCRLVRLCVQRADVKWARHSRLEAYVWVHAWA